MSAEKLIGDSTAPPASPEAIATKRLLDRQRAKATDAEGKVNLDRLLNAVSATYEEFDRDRRRVDRANLVMADELSDTNKSLAKTAKSLQIQNSRFEAAINNMSQGLCMFDAQRRLSVYNHRVLELLGIEDGKALLGLALEQFVEHVMRDRRQSPQAQRKSQETTKAYMNLTQATEGASLSIEYFGGLILHVAHHPTPDGGFVHTFEDITDRRKAEAKVNHLASHDALTDLPNRRLLKLRTEAALEVRPSRNAILCIDLDRFKAVNDTLGHSAGDELLMAVAKRLKESVRQDDTISRLGGDEFTVLLPGIGEAADAGALAKRLVREIGRPYDIAGSTVIIGASIGIAISPRDGDSPDRLIKSADMALYQAKGEGRNCFRFFEPRFDAIAAKRRALEMDLRKALSEEEFELYYQPVLASQTGKIVCFEALLRWNSPERGQVSPVDFIPLAEELGLIVQLGDWVLEQACKTATLWPADIKVAVNVSARQFVNHDVVEAVAKALRESGLSAARLEIEITETALMGSGSIMEVMEKIRALGVGIAMDDFGTGYSSLAYLKRFHFTKVKIDRSFITGLGQEPESIAIVRAVVALCQSLGISTTAEGVETPEQAEILGLEHCTQLQGYLFGRPGPASNLQKVIADNERSICQGFDPSKYALRSAHQHIKSLQGIAGMAIV